MTNCPTCGQPMPSNELDDEFPELALIHQIIVSGRESEAGGLAFSQLLEMGWNPNQIWRRVTEVSTGRSVAAFQTEAR
jgi:hypothetical protein